MYPIDYITCRIGPDCTLADLDQLATFKTPSMWNCCETDEVFPKEKQDALKEAFANKKGSKYHYFAGAKHGSSARGDMALSKRQRRKAHLPTPSGFLPSISSKDHLSKHVCQPTVGITGHND